jgi:hypothetical protein
MDDAEIIGGECSWGDTIDGVPTRGSDVSHSGSDVSCLGEFLPSLTRSLYKLKIARDEIFDTHISVTSTLTSSEESTRGGERALANGEPGVGVTDAPAPVPGVKTGPGFFCCLFLLS